MKAADKRFYFRWGTILLSIVLIFIFFGFFAGRFGQTALALDLGGKKLSITTVGIAASDVSRFDPKDHYIDSAAGFIFQLPTHETFSKPATLEGFDAILEAKAVNLTPEMRDAVQKSFGINPLGPMFESAKAVRIVSGQTLQAEFTDGTSNELIDRVLENVKKASKDGGETLGPEEMKSLRKRFLGLDQLDFQNEFMVTVLSKKKLADVPAKVSLPGLFAVLVSQMGLSIDKLVADENKILAGGSLALNAVKLNGAVRDFQVDRWMLLTENRDSFYLVEIAYSPQSNESIRIWDDLHTLMDSFRVLN